MSHDRRKPARYNTGMLRREKRAYGMVWTVRWSEVTNGRRHQPKIVIGTTRQFPTEAAANREADRFRLRLNENRQSSSLKPLTFGRREALSPQLCRFTDFETQSRMGTNV